MWRESADTPPEGDCEAVGWTGPSRSIPYTSAAGCLGTTMIRQFRGIWDSSSAPSGLTARPRIRRSHAMPGPCSDHAEALDRSKFLPAKHVQCSRVCHTTIHTQDPESPQICCSQQTPQMKRCNEVRAYNRLFELGRSGKLARTVRRMFKNASRNGRIPGSFGISLTNPPDTAKAVRISLTWYNATGSSFQ